MSQKPLTAKTNANWQVLVRSTSVTLIILATGLVTLVGCPNGLASRFTVEIQRDYSTEQEKSLILIAENTYPSREDVVTLYPEGTNPQDLPEDVWWYFGVFGGATRLPYAITADAIEYYQKKVREDGLNYLQEGGFRQFPEARESLYYSATIDYSKSFEGEDGLTFSNVYVVTMLLSFGGSVGPGTGSGFGQDRVVILTPSGEVLQVQGDGEADVGIS